MNFSTHLTRVTQGLRDQVSALQEAPDAALERIHTHAPPPFVTNQDYDTGMQLEGAWMLGQGEEGQLNEDPTCLLQNYWLRVDRDPTNGQNLFAGNLQGRLDLRMNGDDAVLYGHTINSDAGTEFTTQLDFVNAQFWIQKGTDSTLLQSFQVNLQSTDQYLVSLALGEFQYWNVTLESDNATLAMSYSETTGFLLTDAASSTTLQVKNVGGGAKIDLIGEATIQIATADVGGNSCQFYQWTKNGQDLSPPLYVLASQSADIGLPCVFDWMPTTGFLGIGTQASCTALQNFQIEMAYGFNLNAGTTTSSMKLDGGSGNFQVNIAPDESVAAIWQSGNAFINIGLATANNGILLEFSPTLSVALQSGPLASFGNGQHTVQFREIDVCSNGTPMKMIVLASETYTPS